jgi:hypothetical protein
LQQLHLWFGQVVRLTQLHLVGAWSLAPLAVMVEVALPIVFNQKIKAQAINPPFLKQEKI